MNRVLITFDQHNYYAYADGSVTEEREKRRWRRFRHDQWPYEQIYVQYEVPVTDPELVDRVRREAVRQQFLGRTITPPLRQLPEKIT